MSKKIRKILAAMLLLLMIVLMAGSAVADDPIPWNPCKDFGVLHQYCFILPGDAFCIWEMTGICRYD